MHDHGSARRWDQHVLQGQGLRLGRQYYRAEQLCVSIASESASLSVLCADMRVLGSTLDPEVMGKFYIINAPYLFSTVWSFVKPWLDEVTVSKISILGKGFKSELTKQIPEQNLPAELGGSCKCPGGCSLSDAGPWNKN